MSPLFGHEGSSEPSVLFPGVWKNRRCSQCTSCLGTPCLCEQKERWRTPCLKRNPISIINEGVPMEKNIVLISLLDISKALVIALSELLIVCSPLSESRWIFSWFSVTQCHPLIFPAALCPLSCSMLCCILTSASCIPLHITDIISLYFVNYYPWVILLPFLFCSRLPSLIWSGPFPSLLTFGSLFADCQHVYPTQCLFPFFISSNSSLFPCSFFLTTISSCFSALFPLWSQPAHHLGVPDLGQDHQNHQPKVPQRFLGTYGPCQAGKPWPREGAGGWGCWVALGGPDTAPGSRSRLVFTESSFVIVSPSFLIR